MGEVTFFHDIRNKNTFIIFILFTPLNMEKGVVTTKDLLLCDIY